MGIDITNAVRLGGISADRKPYTPAARDLALFLIAQRRRTVALGPDTERGPRFKDDEDVLARLESTWFEAEFAMCPGMTVDKALNDAAGADFYYAHEKGYDDEVEDDHENDGEYDGAD